MVKPLLDYESTCKRARVSLFILYALINIYPLYHLLLIILCLLFLKDELKVYDVDRRKEVNQQKALDRTRINDPANRRKIVSLHHNDSAQEYHAVTKKILNC